MHSLLKINYYQLNKINRQSGELVTINLIETLKVYLNGILFNHLEQENPAEARVPITRGGLTVGTYFREYKLFILKNFWSMSNDVYIFAIESSTVLCSP